MSERRYSAWQMLGFGAVTLAVVGAALLAGFALGFRCGRASARFGHLGYLQGPSFSYPVAPNSIPLPGEGAYLGVTYIEVTPELARREGLTVTAGALIRQIQDGSPAQAADLHVGDVIVKLGDAPIGPEHDLRALVEAHSPGQSLTLTILRGGQTLVVTVTLGAAAVPQAAP